MSTRQLWKLISDSDNRRIIHDLCYKDNVFCMLYTTTVSNLINMITTMKHYRMHKLRMIPFTEQNKQPYKEPVKYPESYMGSSALENQLIKLLTVYFLEGDFLHYNKKDVAIYVTHEIIQGHYSKAVTYAETFGYTIPHMELLLELTIVPYNNYKNSCVEQIIYNNLDNQDRYRRLSNKEDPMLGEVYQQHRQSAM